jgi:hypothetical protein
MRLSERVAGGVILDEAGAHDAGSVIKLLTMAVATAPIGRQGGRCRLSDQSGNEEVVKLTVPPRAAAVASRGAASRR